MSYTIVYQDTFLEHHGIKGMHWGIRRYQNPDGSLTAAGRTHYGVKEGKKAGGYSLSVKLARDQRESQRQNAIKRKENIKKAKDNYYEKVGDADVRYDDDYVNNKNALSKKDFKKYQKERYKEYEKELSDLKKDLKKIKRQEYEKERNTNQKETEAFLDIFRENTSRGANYLKGVLAISGGMAAMGVSALHMDDNPVMALGAEAVGAVLAGIGTTYLSNQYYADKLDRKGHL